jgi:hypothetical protein
VPSGAARRASHSDIVVWYLFAIGWPDAIGPAEPGRRVKVGQRSPAGG